MNEDPATRFCRWCQLTAAEVSWSKNKVECQACNRARQRGACLTCGGPKNRRFRPAFCVRCEDPPEHAVEVILLAPHDDRERKIYRKPWRTGPPPSTKLVVLIYHKEYRVPRERVVVIDDERLWTTLRS